jgi:hypothetical protein
MAWLPVSPEMLLNLQNSLANNINFHQVKFPMTVIQKNILGAK